MSNTQLVAIAKVQTQDKDVNQLQSNVSSSFNQYQVGANQIISSLQVSIDKNTSALATIPFVNGKILTNQSLASGANTIAHGLGRTLTGWIIVRQGASAMIYDTQNSNATPQTTLLLTASAAVTVDIYVF